MILSDTKTELTLGTTEYNCTECTNSTLPSIILESICSEVNFNSGNILILPGVNPTPTLVYRKNYGLNFSSLQLKKDMTNSQRYPLYLYLINNAVLCVARKVLNFDSFLHCFIRKLISCLTL